MAGIVVVSHSAALAEGVVEPARGMAGDDVPIEPAGGLDEPSALGTDAVRLMDLGSAGPALGTAGADKPLRHLARPAEANPFLGVRGLRLSLVRPDSLRIRLRAALRAAEGGPMGIMFPMVSEIEELRAARRVLDEAREALVAEGRQPPAVEVGAMVEVSAAAPMAEALVAEADFLSIGTNDLVQYTMAAERGNAGVARLSDPVHPAALRLVANAAPAA